MKQKNNERFAARSGVCAKISQNFSNDDVATFTHTGCEVKGKFSGRQEKLRLVKSRENFKVNDAVAFIDKSTRVNGFKLELSHKALLLALARMQGWRASFFDANQGCFPKIDTLRTAILRSPRYVTMLLTQLVKAGIITRESRRRKNGSQTTNIYRFTDVLYQDYLLSFDICPKTAQQSESPESQDGGNGVGRNGVPPGGEMGSIPLTLQNDPVLEESSLPSLPPSKISEAREVREVCASFLAMDLFVRFAAACSQPEATEREQLSFAKTFIAKKMDVQEIAAKLEAIEGCKELQAPRDNGMRHSLGRLFYGLIEISEIKHCEARKESKRWKPERHRHEPNLQWSEVDQFAEFDRLVKARISDERQS